MLKKLFTNIWKQIAGLRKDCRGFVVMSTLAIFLFLFVLCASIYAVGETIHQRIKLQNACDAAAYSAAVVQADGLSRMAVVNRAMAWSYVQMTNRQMDYITYRWLKLICKRFKEDSDNAKAYAAQLTLCIDKELGAWAILEALITAVVDRIFNLDCSTGNGHERDVADGRAWWCGLKYGMDRQISLNVNEGFMDAAQSSLTEQFLTLDIIETTINAIGKVIDSSSTEGNPEGWGYWLGKLIDHDKKNIYRMNQTLERINTQMEISMKMTAENVLKAMLKDNRYDSKSILQDYYISIHIPHAENPYNAENENYSFFSPLHNTEADEMLFLNMRSTNYAGKKLHQHFPVLLGGDAIAYGLDQWFIRGMGKYHHSRKDTKNDSLEEKAKQERIANDECCYKSQETKSFDGKNSAWVVNTESERIRLLGTQRKDGVLGIQRVYKDSNLNESGAGIFGNKNDRGNHLIDLSAIANWGLSKVAGYFGGTADTTDEPEDQGSIKDIITDYQSQIAQNQNAISELEKENQELSTTKPAEYEKQIAANNNKIATHKNTIKALKSELDDFTSQIVSGTENLSDNTVSVSKGTTTTNFKNNVLSFATSFGADMIGHFAGNYVDITPSCVNTHEGTKNFMCSEVKTTTALYSQYRWASSKWYCCTKWKAYLYSVIFGAPTDNGKSRKHIYCDSTSNTFWKVPITGKKLKAKGWGHFAFFPKWFCGTEPLYPGNSYVSGNIAAKILEVIPPLTPETIKGEKHGYMKSPLDFFGLWIPIKCLLGNTTMPRDDYASCVVFPDGPFTFAEGKTSYAGFIQGHARIYADDKEIFDNRYVGAICKPWVLNERFFAGEGSIVVGAAMKHTNPFVQLFNFWNTEKKEGTYATGTETQKNAEKTVLSAFNIPEGNFMWTMSAARAGVRHRRRNGAFDQERQYQITYDSTSDAENLTYMSGPYVKTQDGNGWTSPEEWDSSYNKHALSRIYFPAQAQSPVWNGCPCGANSQQFKNMWNLCETDWDAMLLPLRYAGQKASLYLEKEENEDHVNEQHDAFNSKNYSERRNLLGDTDHYKKIGNGKYWVWNGVATDNSSVLMSNPFISSGWKPANAPFFENLVMDRIPGAVSTGISTLEGLNLLNKIPTGKEEKTINILLKDKIL